jgi:two-component system, OmpR family, osmolarity sensor histidine kinase EnvZ
MRFWPRSLVARMTWLVVGVGVLSLVLHLLVIGLLMQPLSEGMSKVLAARVILARELLLRAGPDEHDSASAAISDEQFRLERRALAQDAPREASFLMPGARILGLLRERAGPGISVNFAPAENLFSGGQMQFDFEASGNLWRISYRAQPPVQAVLGTGLGWLAFVIFTMFASLAIGVHWITRPMSLLAQRLAAQGKLLQPLSVPPRAGSELVTLVASFNQLVATVRKADETKQHMLAGVSHDLRTPLARLRLRIETQCEAPVAGALSDDLHAVERIVSQFLAYVQGDSRAGLGEPESVKSVASRVVAGYVAQGHNVEAELGDLDVELPDLAVQRALGNLIDNALSHGKPPVDVVLSRRMGNQGHEAVLTVWDSGRGMNEEEFTQARLPFVRLDGAKSGVGHCGLGLAIVAQIAQQLDITIELTHDADGRYFGISMVWPLNRETQPDLA